MHVLLWTKWSHESTNFDTFKCFNENLPNSSCHFSNYRPVFLRKLHESWVSLRITRLYFFSSYVIYFAQKGQITEQILETWMLGSKFIKFLSVLKQQIVFLQVLDHSSVSWCITPLYFFSWNFIYFQQKEPINVQIWWNFTWAAESLKFSTLMGSRCKNHIKFSLKKYRSVISHDIEEWCKVERKPNLWFQIWHEELGEF